MTTIAYKDGILAADSRASSNGFISHDYGEKIFLSVHPEFGKMLFAVAGDYVEGRHALKSVFAKEQYVPQHSETFFAIIGVNFEGELRVWCTGETHTDGELISAPFYAIGSGKIPAMVAMECGQTAINAVEIAKKFDPFTGGSVYGYPVSCIPKLNWEKNRFRHIIKMGKS
jgi:hypothetical protein